MEQLLTLLVMMDMISMFSVWTLAPKTFLPIEMMLVAIYLAICMQCFLNWFATPEVVIWTENVVKRAPSTGSGRKGERLECLPKYDIQHHLVRFQLSIRPVLSSVAVLDQIE